MAFVSGRMGSGTTKEIDDEHLEEMTKMKLHGEFFRQRNAIINVDRAKSNQWLKLSKFRFETESLICAAQEQTLGTKYVATKIWGSGNDTKCRLCMEQNETINHIVSGCKMLVSTQYTYRHNQLAKYFHCWKYISL